MLQRLAADGVLIRVKPRGYRVPGTGASLVRGTPILELPPDALGIVRGRAGWEKIWDQVEKDLVACMPFGRFKINELAMADITALAEPSRGICSAGSKRETLPRRSADRSASCANSLRS